MKNLLFASILIAFASCSPGKEKVKEAFVTSCMTEGLKELPDAGMKPYLEKYCDCSGDKVVAKYSNDEIAEFTKLTEEEAEAKVMPVVEECRLTLEKEIEEYNAKQGAAKAEVEKEIEEHTVKQGIAKAHLEGEIKEYTEKQGAAKAR